MSEKIYSNIDEKYIRFDDNNKVEIMKLLLSHKHTYVKSEYGGERLFATSNKQMFDEYVCGYDERKIFIQDDDALDDVARYMKYPPLEISLRDRYLIGYNGLSPDGINTKENYFVVLGNGICITHIRPNKSYDNNFREINISELKDLVSNPDLPKDDQHFKILLDIDILEDYAKDYDRLFNDGTPLKINLSNPNALENKAQFVAYDWDYDDDLMMGVSTREKNWSSFLLPVECKDGNVAQILCDEFSAKARELYSVTQEGDDVYFVFGKNYTPQKFEFYRALQKRAKELNGDWEGSFQNNYIWYVQLSPVIDTKDVILSVVPKYYELEFNIPLMYNSDAVKYNDKHLYFAQWYNLY